MDDLKILITGDGSATILSKQFNEAYHNINGAIAEAKHIYANSAFAFDSLHVKIIEFGFGTGLNAMQTYVLLKQTNKIVEYTGIELFPIEKNVFDKLNYQDILGLSNKEHALFCSNWNQKLEISNSFFLTKIVADITSFQANDSYDLVFYDAFSPEIQPELWKKEIFDTIFSSLNHGGKLYTYCAKGIVKQSLRDAGFKVKRLAGPPGKRHIVEASKT